MIGTFTPRQNERMWRALGRDDLADEVKDLRIPDMRKRIEKDEAALIDIIATRTADEWEDLLNAAGVPAARVRTLDEALESPQIKARQVCGEFSNLIYQIMSSARQLPVLDVIPMARRWKLRRHDSASITRRSYATSVMAMLRSAVSMMKVSSSLSARPIVCMTLQPFFEIGISIGDNIFGQGISLPRSTFTDHI